MNRRPYWSRPSLVSGPAALPNEPRDRGSSILLVLASLTAVALFATVALGSAVAGLKTADRSTSWNQALSAAEAGVADYVARLNRDDQYWQDSDCTNVALKGPRTTSNVCSWNSTTPVGWQAVPGAPNSSFHYDVDAATTYSSGAIRLVSTGKVGRITRTVEVRLRRGGFGEFLYYTAYETIDPGDENAYGVANSIAQEYCARYNWPSLPSSQRRPSTYYNGVYYCPRINFVTGDVINGPLHSNDAFQVQGSPTFQGTTTTSNPGCRSSEAGPPPTSSCYLNGGYANPTFERGIAYRAEIELPTSVGDLRKYVTPGQTPSPGCLYTGPTRIKYLPTSGSSVPQMRVWSKFTTTAQLNPGCGTAGTSGSEKLGTSGGQVVSVPQDRLILVQDVPSNQSNPSSSGCKTTGGIGDGLPIAESKGSYDVNLDLRESDCRYGTVYVEGTLKGRSTIVVDNNIIITGNLTYAGGRSGTDSLGLIAKNSVKVYHPVTCDDKDRTDCGSWSNLTGTNFNVEISAAILTLQHSFAVQTYYRGAKLGTLKVYGSIAQRFRGPVGTSGGSGYLKNYSYDTRLRYAPPPFFLDPVRSGWGQKTFGELVPRYRS